MFVVQLEKIINKAFSTITILKIGIVMVSEEQKFETKGITPYALAAVTKAQKGADMLYNSFPHHQWLPFRDPFKINVTALLQESNIIIALSTRSFCDSLYH